jgi:hypothetical protein
MALLTWRVVVTSACSTLLTLASPNERYAHCAQNDRVLPLFRKTFGYALCSGLHSTRCITRVARMYACGYTCTSDKLFNCATRHVQAAIIINFVFPACSLRVNRARYGCFAVANVFIFALSGYASVIDDEAYKR